LVGKDVARFRRPSPRISPSATGDAISAMRWSTLTAGCADY